MFEATFCTCFNFWGTDIWWQQCPSEQDIKLDNSYIYLPVMFCWLATTSPCQTRIRQTTMNLPLQLNYIIETLPTPNYIKLFWQTWAMPNMVCCCHNLHLLFIVWSFPLYRTKKQHVIIPECKQCTWHWVLFIQRSLSNSHLEYSFTTNHKITCFPRRVHHTTCVSAGEFAVSE